MVASVATMQLAPANGIKWHSTTIREMVGTKALEYSGGGGGDTYSKWWFERRLFLNVTLRTALFSLAKKEVEKRLDGKR